MSILHNICFFVDNSTHLLIDLQIHISIIYRSIYISIFPSIYIFIHLSIYLFIYQSRSCLVSWSLWCAGGISYKTSQLLIKTQSWFQHSDCSNIFSFVKAKKDCSKVWLPSLFSFLSIYLTIYPSIYLPLYIYLSI